MESKHTPEQLADKAFDEYRGSNINFWMPRDQNDEEVKYWKSVWIMGYTALLEENEKLKYRILEIEKCEQDLSGRLQAEVDRLTKENEKWITGTCQ